MPFRGSLTDSTQPSSIQCKWPTILASTSRPSPCSRAWSNDKLTGVEERNRTYELAGNPSFSMTEIAQELSKRAGKQIVYNDMKPSEYRSLWLSVGLPPVIVDVGVDAEVKSQTGT